MNVLMLVTKPVRTHPRVFKEAKTLVEGGHDVTVLEWARHRPDEPPQEDLDGVRVARSHNTRFMRLLGTDLLRNPVWWRRAVHHALRLHKKAPFDVVHCHDLDTLRPGVALKKKLGVKVVFDVHDIFSYMIEEDFPAPVPWTAQRMEDRLLPHVDHIILASEAYRPFYEARVRSPMTLVENCPDATPATVPPSASAFSVTYIGVLHHSRFFPQAVDALGDLPGVRFVIAGKREGLYGKVEAAAAKYANVEFLGTIPFQQVIAKTLEGHAILCLFDPSHRINQVGSPNKMYEAMVTGRPIIVSKGTFSGTFVERHGYGVAIDYDAASLRAAVERLRDDPELWRRLASAARRKAPEFTWATQGAHLRQAYASLEVAP